ncbi:MAG: peptidyl-prolyl cis-trans isomerase, partial [Rhodothermales bacterium]|nr:peptidyl-prolyl cis-trans isomerase [Rhodothermales bacterium]
MRLTLIALAALLGVSACNGPPVSEDYVARMGSESLTATDLDQALTGLPAGVDSTDAAQQFVEQWVTNQLLLAEARRRGLDRSPEVQAQVAAAERAVLVDALLGALYDEASEGPSEAELAEYFERNRERLQLVEPYVRLRYVVTDQVSVARDARRQLITLDSTQTDAWSALLESTSNEPELSRTLTMSLVPQTRAFAEYPGVGRAVINTREGRTTPVIEDRGLYHVVQVVERVPAGTL